MKILYVATVRSHIGQFHIDFLKKLKELGVEIHAAYRDNSEDKPGLDLSVIDRVYEIPFQRSPYKIDNIRSYFKLKKIIDSEKYDLIHCHTPVGGIITRLAARHARKKGTKIVYTAHGFHFFKGAVMKNWLIYYTLEKMFANMADAIITINKEDYERAKLFKCKNVYLVHGVGVDINKFHVYDGREVQQIKDQYGYSKKFIIVYPADLSERKNQIMLVDVASRIKERNPKLDFVILMPGQPIMKEILERKAAENGVSENCLFMGYRRDINDLVAMSDVMVSSSKQEGLPVCVMEAMAEGKPIVCTKVRGNEDLVIQGENGYLCNVNDIEAMADYILQLNMDREKRIKMGAKSRSMIEEEYCTEVINEKLLQIYKKILHVDDFCIDV